MMPSNSNSLCVNNNPWIQSVCAHSKRHPAGGSFADRYVAHYPENNEQDSSVFEYQESFASVIFQARKLNRTRQRSTAQWIPRAWQQGDVLWLSGEQQGWKAIPSKFEAYRRATRSDSSGEKPFFSLQ
ncbi:DUF3404 domain-containing protein [Vibrio lentus]|nr:DUF3404 domain-containing protein [Vibrio lentus]